MTKLKRYARSTEGYGAMDATDDGDWVKYETAKRLMDALEPFAALLQKHHERIWDGDPVFGMNDVTITAKHLREARAAIAAAREA